MKPKLMNMAAMALSALLCFTTTGAWAGVGYPFTWSASNLYDGSGSYVPSGTAAYLVVSSLAQGALLGAVNEYGYDSIKSSFEGKTVEYNLAIAQVDASGAVNGEEIFFASVDGESAYLLVFTGENLYISETVTAASSAFAFGDQTTVSSASPKLASGGFQGAGWYTTSSAPEPAQPEWVQDGDTWDEATKTLTVNSNTANEAYRGQTVIEHVIISSGVTSVGNAAFYECTGLTSITIGNNVTSIGTDAFYGCTGLTSVTIGNSVTSIGNEAFYGCTGLTSITIPNSVTSIGTSAFYNCSGLTSVTIGNSVTSIGSEAFFSCSGLTSIVVASENTTYDSRDNCNAIIETSSNTLVVGCKNTIIPNSVTSIVYAFPGCTGLTSIEIPNSVTNIGDGAFFNCSGLTSVTIPNGVTSIGLSAFAGCSNLESVTIPNSVTSIGMGAFGLCSGLTSVTNYAVTPQTLNSYAFYNVNTSSCTLYVPAESVSAYSAADFWKDFGNIQAIPAPEPSGPHGECGAQGNNVVWSLNTATGVLTISGTGAMADYESVDEQPWKDYRSTITSVVVEEGVTTIGTAAFDGCSGLTSVTIPNSVTSIGSEAFFGCTVLTSVAIPNSVTSIGGGAFEDCSGLTSVTIPNSVTSIGDRAFSYCSGLTSIIIPNSVTSIGEDVFNGCSGLTSIEIPNSVTSIGWCAFFGCEGLTSITIPNSVEYIGEGAFFGCTNITDVYCYPSAADLTWNEEDCNDFKDDGSTVCHVLANQLSAYQEKFTGEVNVTFEGDLPPAWLLDGDEWDDATKTLTVNSDLPGNAYANNTEIEHVIINNGVTSIGEAAFAECSGLTSVTIPNSVTSIGYATFAGCTGLTSVTIPNSVISIGNAAFYQCSGLTSITIPNSVTSIGNLAFRYCSGLETVTILAESLESYGTNAFQGTAEGLKIYVPAGSVATYKAGWAAYVDQIVAIPPAWLLDGDEWDYATKTLTVNSNPGSSAYSDVSDIENLVISDAVTSIGEKAFFGCEGLTSVTIGNSVTSIGEAAFVLCTGLTNMVVASGNTTYDSRENCNAIIETSSNTLIAGCKSTIIPSSVTSIGEYAFENCTGLTSITIPNSVTSIGQTAFASCSGLTSVTIGNSVTSIGAGAFMECYDLTSVTIGNSVESIGEWAFLYCASLTSITIPNSVTSIGDQAFAGCTGLTSIEIPNSSIGMGAFYGCTGLTSVTIGNSVTSIGYGAFYECSGLEKVTILAESLESYGSDAFEGTAEGLKIYVPAGSVDTYKAGWTAYADKIKAIPPAWVRDGDEWDDATKTLTVNSNPGSAAYMGKNVIEHVIISSGVTSIGYQAFYGCKGLTSVTIGNSVTSIGALAFDSCVGLTSVTIGNSVTSIGAQAFSQCIALTSITIPNSVTSIGALAFDSCVGLTSVTIGNSVTSIGAQAFSQCIALTSITIPNSVTSIGGMAFALCIGLESITIPNSVTSIEYGTFAGCSDLTSIVVASGNTKYDSRDNCNAIIETATNTLIAGCPNTIIPNSVTSIGFAAFYYCTALTSIEIPNSVTSIGDYAFDGCSGLETVTINATTPPTLGSDAFEGTAEGLKIYVPAGSVDTYKAGWTAYADKIEAITTVTYETWAEENSITGAMGDKDENGIYNVFRYVFDKPTGVFPLITGIDVGESEVVITTSAVVNSDGVTVLVVESSDLAGKTVTDTEALEPEGRAEFTKSAETPRFYRLKAEVTIAAPAATVTTAQTAKTGVKAGQNEAIVNAGTAEGGTMMYAVTTDNTQPASTDGFSATVPTAEGLTAGTYYVWCYVKADDSHTDSEISATGIEVTIAADVEPTLANTINNAGMTVKVKYNYSGESYCLFLSNGDGTYTFQSGNGYVGGDDGCAKALVVEGGKLVFKQNFYDTIDDQWEDNGFSVTFDTGNNYCSEWAGDFAQEENAYFISVEVNGTEVPVDSN